MLYYLSSKKNKLDKNKIKIDKQIEFSEEIKEPSENCAHPQQLPKTLIIKETEIKLTEKNQSNINEIEAIDEKLSEPQTSNNSERLLRYLELFRELLNTSKTVKTHKI